MADLEFVDNNNQPLELEDDGNIALIDQYCDWKAICLDPKVESVRLGNSGTETSIALEQADGQNILRSEKLKVGSATGKLEFFDQDKRLLHPTLFVLPRISNADFKAILDDIDLLALWRPNAKAPVNIRSDIAPSGTPILEHTQRTQAIALCEFATLIQKQWPLILARPAEQLSHQLTPLQTTRAARTAREMIGRIQKPNREHHVSWRPQSTRDTSENRFLAFVLHDVYLPYSQRELSVLKNQLEELEYTMQSYQNRGKYASLSLDRKPNSEQKKKDIQNLIERLEYLRHWAKETLKTPWLKHPERPTQPSAKLLQSKEYGPIYRAYVNLIASIPPELGIDIRGRFTWLEDRHVAPMNTLYERWVFLKVYEMLREFGFEPATPNGKTPFEDMKVVNGILKFEQEKPYVLEWKSQPQASTTREIQIELGYDRAPRQYSGLRPDVSLSISVDKGKKHLFALDAKYRSGIDLPDYLPEKKKIYGTLFNVDLLGTAKTDYLDKLDSAMSFILHSDEKEQQYWGERPLAAHGIVRPNQEPDHQPVGHRFGAVLLKPGFKGRNTLKKLLRMVLMYHLKISDICWTCGSQVSPQPVNEKGEASFFGKGRAYQCCDQFWVVSNCQGLPKTKTPQAKHYLVKWGNQSFHATEADDHWACICPECEDRFGSDPVLV
jgi:PD-(D/E)XK nuclease superfamily